jgi:dGTP triphosphohydrolase
MVNPCETGASGNASVSPMASSSSAPDMSMGLPHSSDRGQDRLSPEALGFSLKETAQTAADAVRQQAVQFAQDVGHELSKTGEAEKARGAHAMRHFARAINSAATELESQSPTVARTVHQTARQVERLSDNLSGRSANELIESAAQLARTQPALFIGGSLAAGFALARFLKSSSRQQSGAGSDT